MVNGFHSVLKLRKSEMSNILISFILLVLIYCTLTCFHLAYKLAVMKTALETVLADNKDFDNEDLFKKDSLVVSFVSIQRILTVRSS